MALRETAAGLALLTVVSGFGSQLPEAWNCEDNQGKNAASYGSGEVPFVHCDSENMSPVGNAIHDTGKIISLGALAGAGVLVMVDRRRKLT